MAEGRSRRRILALDPLFADNDDRDHDGEERDQGHEFALATQRSRHGCLAITSRGTNRANFEWGQGPSGPRQSGEPGYCVAATMSNSLPSGSASVTHCIPDSSKSPMRVASRGRHARHRRPNPPKKIDVKSILGLFAFVQIGTFYGHVITEWVSEKSFYRRTEPAIAELHGR